MFGRERKAEAQGVLLRSLHAYPCNWSAWLSLAALNGGSTPGSCGQAEGDPGLPRHWTRDFYLAHVCLDAQENDEALGRLQVPVLDCSPSLDP